MKKKLLIVVDMQYDFIDGALANKDAQAILDDMVKYIKKFDGDIIFTKDTHDENYMKSQEGKFLPIPHCIKGTMGWCVHEDLINAASKHNVEVVEKPTFGYAGWLEVLNKYELDEIIMVGTCTDICVVSNALAIKAAAPETLVSVIGSLCAGLTREKHEAALEVMRSCQIKIL